MADIEQSTEAARPANTQITMTRAPLRGGSPVVAIIPTDLEAVWRIATMAVSGAMAPDSLLKEKGGAWKPLNDAISACAIAIMAGAEMGLTPLAALRSYAVVNGRPTLWGDGIKAVVRQSGICEYIKTGSDDTKGWCEAKRKDTAEVQRKEFTIEQAKKAGLLNKKGPWQDYPDMMMERRATFRCLNDLFADVLAGIVSAEEASDYTDYNQDQSPPPRQLPPEPPEEPSDTYTAAKAPEPPHGEDGGQGGADERSTSPATKSEPQEVLSTEDTLAELEELLSHAADAEAVEKAFDDFDVPGKLSGNDDALARAFALKKVALGDDTPHDPETGEFPPEPPDDSTPRAEGVNDMFSDDTFPGDRSRK